MDLANQFSGEQDSQPQFRVPGLDEPVVNTEKRVRRKGVPEKKPPDCCNQDQQPRPQPKRSRLSCFPLGEYFQGRLIARPLWSVAIDSTVAAGPSVATNTGKGRRRGLTVRTYECEFCWDVSRRSVPVTSSSWGQLGWLPLGRLPLRRTPLRRAPSLGGRSGTRYCRALGREGIAITMTPSTAGSNAIGSSRF